MVFSSVTFLVYFLPLLLVIHHFTPHKYRNGLLLVASIFFYSWGAPKFIFVILITTFLDFYLVKVMDKTVDNRKRKLILILSICMNLGLLVYFKYCNFFIENVNHVIDQAGYKPMGLLNLVLPIGISFYTFESLTYVIDVYRKVHKPLDNFWNYQLYILLFPKLIAGPIVRYHEIADQVTNRTAQDTAEYKLQGFLRFTIGLAKKVFIANTLAGYADEVFDSSLPDVGARAAWIGTLSYTFQIYFDFSGYSDMAIGLGQLFGFRFPENFNNPYTSGSITEFWRRWHITLGKWMKNYLYIPLGGNRVPSTGRIYFNLWLVFLASGLWHGASWNFIAWGIYHGVFIVLERIFLLGFYKRLGRIPSTLITFLIVAIGWVIFRSESLQQCGNLFRNLIAFNVAGLNIHLNNDFKFYFILAVLFSFVTLSKWGLKIEERFYNADLHNNGGLKYAFFSLVLFTFALANLASSEFNPFIYFRF